MGRPRFQTLIAAVAIGCATLAGSDPATATSLRHVGTRELTLGSGEIVIGTVETVRSYWNPARTRILTDVTVRVARSLKGGSAERLTLTQLGGEVDGARYEVPGSPRFQPGQESLLFVWRDRAGRAQVNGLGQGKFDIRRDRVTGRATVERAPGFAMRDARTLGPLSATDAANAVSLDALVTEIERVLTGAP